MQPDLTRNLACGEGIELVLAVEFERDGRPSVAVCCSVDTAALARVDTLMQIKLLDTPATLNARQKQ